MKKSPFVLNAATLRIILFVTLFLTTGAIVGGFLYAQGALQPYAVEVGHKKADADASNGNIQALETTKNTLAKNQDVIDKANDMKAVNEFPEFKIVEDVTTYATKNGLAIDSISFTGATTDPGEVAVPATPAPVAPGGKTVGVIVNLTPPVNYSSLLQFVSDIEQTLPKMQIKSLSLQPGESSQIVLVNSIEITMYTR